MKHTKLGNNQSGLVAIVVTMIFMSIITLVVISFAFLMRREQQQILDRQLSTQAFYAAESGINDTIVKLQSGAIANDITDCNDNQEDITSDGIVSYSCVLVTQDPDSVEYQSVPVDGSKIARLKASNGENIASVEISWEAKDSLAQGHFATNTVYRLPTANFAITNPDTFSNYIGIMRATIIPVSNPSSTNRSTLNSADRTLFFYPTGQSVLSDNNVINYTEANADGAFINGKCSVGNQPRQCKATMNGMNHQEVYVRLKSIYQDSAVTIKAYNGSGQLLKLAGIQAVIDSTGKANDVLRRIQVRVPLQKQYDYPEFTVESLDDICKELTVGPPAQANHGTCDIN